MRNRLKGIFGPRSTNHGHDPGGGGACARVVVLYHFLNFSIDALMVYLFKLIDLSIELTVWY
jgi:hypothetical protein